MGARPRRGQDGGTVAKRISKAASGVSVPAQLDGQLTIDEALEAIERAGDREDADWTALESFNLGELVLAICAADAGVMIRSADRGKACAIGVFVGGRSSWTTCRDQRDALAILDACVERLVPLAGMARVHEPTRKARRRS